MLRCINPLEMDDVILGQYVGNPEMEGDAKAGYLDDTTVPKGSVTPTFAVGAFRIKNERWDGVPFILKCGKGMCVCVCVMCVHVRACMYVCYNYVSFQP